MQILGLSCFYHDSAACLVEDGRLVAAAQEERFSRRKHDEAFPLNAIRYCLAEAESDGRVDAVAFYDKPILKFHRILETYFATAPRGLRPFMQAVPTWLHEKLWMEATIRDSLHDIGIQYGELYFSEHHESHAASAFYPSPFSEAAVLTVDGVGEWATATIGVGEGSHLQLVEELDFPHSLGLLYSAFTYYTGFRVNSGEYKLMGLAPYGKGTYSERILQELLDLRRDGSFRLNMDYFAYLDDLVMTSTKFESLFDGPPRQPESPVTQREMDIAKSIQEVTEEIVLRMARHTREVTGKKYLCLSGGVALNCVSNGKLLREGVFDDIWIQPAAGDAGGAIGAALAVWYQGLGNPRDADGKQDSMEGSYLGPEFGRDDIKDYLDTTGCRYRELSDAEWAPEIARLVAAEAVVGLFHGRMEFGPRALGNRSIIADPRSPEMQSKLNLKIKFRESFRPFAPSCLEERVSDYFELDHDSPYMLLVADIREHRRIDAQGNERDLEIHEWVNRARSDLPAITHVDYSARIQSVSRDTNPNYHRLLTAFEEQTGCGVLINTSFNVRGEPIVCTPSDAYQCFMRTEMDHLVLGPFLLNKEDQPAWKDGDDWQEVFVLD
jgi:carbamoyltransferase